MTDPFFGADPSDHAAAPDVCGLDDAPLAEPSSLGLHVPVGEDVLDRSQAQQTVAAYLDLLTGLEDAGLAYAAEVSVKLSAVGQALPGDGEHLAYENAALICEKAKLVGTTVTLDMEDHTTTDSTLAILHELRKDFPETGAVLQAYLHRSEDDCRALAHEGSRIRLCKGAYEEPAEVALKGRSEVSAAYVAAARTLFAGRGYPMLATHDPELIAAWTDPDFDPAPDHSEPHDAHHDRPTRSGRALLPGLRGRRGGRGHVGPGVRRALPAGQPRGRGAGAALLARRHLGFPRRADVRRVPRAARAAGGPGSVPSGVPAVWATHHQQLDLHLEPDERRPDHDLIGGDRHHRPGRAGPCARGGGR